MKLLVTAGPTREFIDPVRFLSNRSSGKMGFAVAAEAAARGHQVALITGPVTLQLPQDTAVTQVVSAAEMCAAVEENLPVCDALVMAAAVADWRPAEVRASKMKKSEDAGTLRLVRTVDILARVLSQKGSRIFVGFAAETDHLVEEASRKLREKGLDLIVANDVSARDAGFETDDNRVTLLSKNGMREDLPLMSKREVAKRIVDWIESNVRDASS